MMLTTRMLHELGLSADQEKKLREIHLAAGKKKIQLHAEKATLELDLRNVFATYPVDKSAAVNLAGKIADVDKRMILHRVETLSQVLGALTAEQHAKLLSMQEEWREKRRAWRDEFRKEGFSRRDRKRAGHDPKDGD
jgi:Spy/CpxP family protein refolding chaperone